MKVCFAYPDWTGASGLYGWFSRRNASYPPLSLALLAAVLIEKGGYDVRIIDGLVEGYDEDRLVQEIISGTPDVVGFSAYSPTYHIQKSIAEKLKAIAPDIITIVGGPHVSIVKEDALKPCFDYAVVGEAEDSLPELLETIQSDGDVSKVKGIVFHRDGEAVFTGAAAWQADFNKLPIPARHLLPMKSYRLGTLRGRLNFTSLQTTRGCPWKCIFCKSDQLNTTRVLRRTPESVVAEIKQVVTDFGIRHFQIVDDVLTLHKEHILGICDLLEKEGLNITFEGATRANLVDDELIKRLAESGLIRLSFGLETADPEIRDIMKKKVPLKYYVEANKILNKHNVEVLNSVMIGLPGESRASVRRTLTFLREAKEVKQASFAIAIPYPGTELHDMAQHGDNGIRLLTDDFSEYRRYGSAVTEVNGLTPNDLVELQNEGFVSIYSAPWRWRSLYGKYGIIGVLLTAFRLVRLAAPKLFKKVDSTEIVEGHYGSPRSPNI